METKTCIILAWANNAGVRYTGRLIRPDGVNYVEETEYCQKGNAVVFSRSMGDLDRANNLARVNGYTVFILPDTDDGLSVARKMILEQAKNNV
mgnify:CR=1 FL=1